MDHHIPGLVNEQFDPAIFRAWKMSFHEKTIGYFQGLCVSIDQRVPSAGGCFIFLSHLNVPVGKSNGHNSTVEVSTVVEVFLLQISIPGMITCKQ